MAADCSNKKCSAYDETGSMNCGISGFTSALGCKMYVPTENKNAPCPWCGGAPEVTEHFRDDLWRLLHRCPVMGIIVLDWNDKGRNEALWNQRANTADADT